MTGSSLSSSVGHPITTDRFTTHFALSGRSAKLDPRVNAARGDIADIALAGTLFAPHYARPVLRHCAAPSTLMRAAGAADAPLVSQLLHGEAFAVLDVSGGWAWGYSVHDHYVGYVAADMLASDGEFSHRVTAPAALVYAAPDLKSPAVGRFTLGALVQAEGEGEWLAVAGGHMFAAQLEVAGVALPDPAALAEALAGEPYLWGGRGDGGFDCSGLVQIVFGLSGHALPRDSDQQCAAAGAPIPDGEALRRGDLVFFPGHVGIMVDGERILHATAFAMAVIVESLADLISRTAAEHEVPVLARRRIS